MITNYCLSSINDITDDTLGIKVGQITLNGRIYPASRKTANTLKTLRDKAVMDVIIHYDFTWIISRYKLVSKTVQKDIVSEIVSIMGEALNWTDHKILGIVMHTDFPFRRELFYTKLGVSAARFKLMGLEQKDSQRLYAEYSESLADELYKNQCWDLEQIHTGLRMTQEEYYKETIYEFTNDLCKAWFTKYQDTPMPFKVYLENTTKIPFTDDFSSACGSVNHLVSLLEQDEYLNQHLGIVIDTEHDYAVTGNKSYIKTLEKDIDFILHLNPIPIDVKPGLLKDSHSSTSLFECSVRTPKSYMNMIKYLNEHQIPYVRECHNDTMEREQLQLKNYIQNG